jgi:hypothetical protein
VVGGDRVDPVALAGAEADQAGPVPQQRRGDRLAPQRVHQVRRAGLAEDARGGQGIVRGRVRLAELELIAAGDALARVMLTAPLLP